MKTKKLIKTLSADQVKGIQTLYLLNIPKTIIARHFNITPPSVTYYTAGIAPIELGILLDILQECDLDIARIRDAALLYQEQA